MFMAFGAYMTRDASFSQKLLLRSILLLHQGAKSQPTNSQRHCEEWAICGKQSSSSLCPSCTRGFGSHHRLHGHCLGVAPNRLRRDLNSPHLPLGSQPPTFAEAAISRTLHRCEADKQKCPALGRAFDCCVDSSRDLGRRLGRHASSVGLRRRLLAATGSGNG